MYNDAGNSNTDAISLESLFYSKSFVKLNYIYLISAENEGCMNYLVQNRTLGLALLLVVISFTLSCSKTPPLEEKILGTWRIKRANIHSVFSFRANGSWTASERVEGRFSKIVESKGKVVGQWELVESEGEEEGLNLIMTPTKVESVKGWEQGVPVQFKIAGVDLIELNLVRENGKTLKLSRVRGKKASEDEVDEGVAKAKTGPVVVNLRRDRAHGKFRYLCIELELSIEEAEGCKYIAVQKDPETGESSYTLHPKIKEIAIIFFSSLTYKETKTLNKVKEVVKGFQTVLNPYLCGNLVDIGVVKVVVTTNIESVKEFENAYEPTESEDADAEEGGSA